MYDVQWKCVEGSDCGLIPSAAPNSWLSRLRESAKYISEVIRVQS